MDKTDSVNRSGGDSDVHKEIYLAIATQSVIGLSPKEGGKPLTRPELRGLLKSS